ncbi:MAG: aldehyde dehydrogenase family protein [Caulobacteraceae bacterium]
MLDESTFDETYLGACYDNFIDGEWEAPARGRYLANRSPIDGSILCEVARSDADDVERALDAAISAHGAWAGTARAERCRILSLIADTIEDNADLLAHVEALDSGKSIGEALTADVILAADHFRHFAGLSRADEVAIDRDWVADGEPTSVVNQISTWNFSLLMAARRAAPALLAGNCIVIKPAPDTPMNLAVLTDLISDLLPPGVLNVVFGRSWEVGTPLARSPHVVFDDLADESGWSSTSRSAAPLAPASSFAVSAPARAAPPVASRSSAGFWKALLSARRASRWADRPTQRSARHGREETSRAFPAGPNSGVRNALCA